MACHRQHHISGWPALLLAPLVILLLAPFVIPLILIVLILQKLTLLKSTVDLTADDVANYIEDFLEDRSGDWDWDDFTSIPISDPALDRIREEALAVDFPLTVDGEAVLRGLVGQARAS